MTTSQKYRKILQAGEKKKKREIPVESVGKKGKRKTEF